MTTEARKLDLCHLHQMPMQMQNIVNAQLSATALLNFTEILVRRLFGVHHNVLEMYKNLLFDQYSNKGMTRTHSSQSKKYSQNFTEFA